MAISEPCDPPAASRGEPGSASGKVESIVDARRLLTINTGSSSLKAALYRLRADTTETPQIRAKASSANEGLHHACSFPALQRPQRPFGRAQRVPPVVPQPVVAGSARAVACATDPGRLRTVPATRVRYCESESRRLARVRRGCQLRPVAARVEQTVRLREIKESAFGSGKVWTKMFCEARSRLETVASC